MPDIRVTPEASAEIRKRIEGCYLPNAFVAVFRDIKQADLSRGPKGEAVWAIEEPLHTWRCEVIALPNEVLTAPGYEPSPVFHVDGIPFAVSERLDRIKSIDVGLVEGTLRVRVSDA